MQLFRRDEDKEERFRIVLLRELEAYLRSSYRSARDQLMTDEAEKAFCDWGSFSSKLEALEHCGRGRTLFGYMLCKPKRFFYPLWDWRKGIPVRLLCIMEFMRRVYPLPPCE